MLPDPDMNSGNSDPPLTAWDLYNKKASLRDKHLVKGWDSGIDNLLLFATIFAVVVTAVCVESRKLLEPDPLDSIDQTLIYMVQRSIDPSIAPPPPRGLFEPPTWAVIVNGLLFTSLTVSVLAAVIAVTCQQWVREYHAGVEAAGTPRERAVRSHYRYRATEHWYMRHIIASLPIILYLAVEFFFIGLMLWLWQVYWALAFIPLAGLLIWAIGYTATTLMAVFYPSAPYRTALSKALFRVIYLGRSYAWEYTRIAIRFYRPALKSLRHFFSRDARNEFRNQYIREKIEFSGEMKYKLLDDFPWVPTGHDVQKSIHSHIREQGSIARDETIRISTLAWLASSMDLSENSAPELYLVLAELNNLPGSKLSHWPAHNYDAPWSQIFKIVLAASIETGKRGLVLHHGGAAIPGANVVHTLAQILHKMSLHPTLFENVIQDMDSCLLLEFMDLLKSKRPTSSADAQRRLETITLLVSSKIWTRMSPEEQPVIPVIKVISDCLDLTDAGINLHLGTSWVFTLCYVKKVRGAGRNVLAWPNPGLIRYIPDAFNNQNLREYAITLFLQFIDAILCDTEPAASTEWRWKWNKDSRAQLTDKFVVDESGTDKLVVMRLLVHLLRIFFTFPESQHSEGLFNELVGQGTTTSDGEKITNPALRLVIMAFGGHRKEVEFPPYKDRIWGDPVWQYAISVWFGFQTDYAVSNGYEIFDLVRPEESARLVEGFRKANLPAFSRLIRLSTQHRSSKYLRFWNRLFILVPNSEREISRALSSPGGLPADQWFQLFTEVQSIEGPSAVNPTTAALLQALRDSLRTALVQQLWRRTIVQSAKSQDQSFLLVPTTPIARLIQLVMEVRHRETPNRRSGSLPLGMLELTSNFIRNYTNNANFQRLQICVYIVDELALAYTAGSMRDSRYTRLFLEISIALEPICKGYIVRPSTAPLNAQAHEALLWSAKLEAAFHNTSNASGLPLRIEMTRAPVVSDLETEYTTPIAPATDGVLHRMLSRTPNVALEDKV